jgi:hypothetical protein
VGDGTSHADVQHQNSTKWREHLRKWRRQRSRKWQHFHFHFWHISTVEVADKNTQRTIDRFIAKSVDDSVFTIIANDEEFYSSITEEVSSIVAKFGAPRWKLHLLYTDRG